jgi:hypothetical protein
MRKGIAGLTVVVVMAALPLAGIGVKATDLSGRVQGAGQPIAGATVTLYAAGSGAPAQLAQARTDAEGAFRVTTDKPVIGGSFYLIAKGGTPKAAADKGPNDAIALLAVVGPSLPERITVNEFTTIASVWTHNQLMEGTALKGTALQLKIAAGNVPSFVDLRSGGWGTTILDPLNGSQTPTMANFATLADALAGCITRVTADAAGRLFAAAKGPAGAAPSDTLTAAQAIARYPWYQPERVFGLLEAFYPVPAGRPMRSVPFMPYLNFPPSAWVLPLKFDGGGYRAGGKCMFDSEGNLWVGDNFTVGWQAQDALWQGNATKFDPNGKPLSPSPTGFAGGGMAGGTFGAAVDAKDNAWFGTYGGRSIAIFDKNGKPLTPPEGITFDGRLGLMQGIIVAPNGDVWALGISKRQLLYFPLGDWNKGIIFCEGDSGEPCRSFTAPFHLAIDQQDRIWVADSSNHVFRFPAADPTKVTKFDVGSNNSGLNIDGSGNVWVTNRFGSGVVGMAHLADMALHLKTEGVTSAADYLTKTMSEQKGGSGSVTLLRPDGTEFPGSPFKGGGLPGPWAVVVDGNENVWISNFAMPTSPITQLCGARPENCPPGFKTGDQISPPGGYVGGGLQMQTDLAIGPAGDVWVMNNWQDIDSCFGNPNEALSTRCGGQGVVIFFGMAKPVRAPQIGPARLP